MERLRAAFRAWLYRPTPPLDVESVRAYRDATHVGMCDIGQGFGRSNLERVLDNERYLASFGPRLTTPPGRFRRPTSPAQLDSEHRALT